MHARKQRGTGLSISALWIARFLALVAFFCGIVRPGEALAERYGHVLVVEDDGRILEPASPLPWSSQRLDFLPAADGGYALHASRLRWRPQPLGEKLVFPADGATAARVDLEQPVRLYGFPWSSIWVHPDGAIAFGEDWPTGARADVHAPGGMLASLLSGPPVVAPLWNDLDPLAAGARGVFVRQHRGVVTVTWLDVPSARPAGVANSFRVFLHRDGRVVLEHFELKTRWGIVGLSPGSARDATTLRDLRGVRRLPPGEATLAWYRDRPRLDTTALARRVNAELEDRFEFLTVFTQDPVDAPHLVHSRTVANDTVGLGIPVFDHGAVHGSAHLEHIVVMNDLDFWADNPADRPRHPAYSWAPSTLAVLAHEVGHRWIPRLVGEPFSDHPGSGHWSAGLETQASFLGGGALRKESDGSFRVAATMKRYGYIDRYLMGLIPPESVPPFFRVDAASAGGHPFAEGTRFAGKHEDLVIDDLLDQLGTRYPAASDAQRDFRMAFVYVVPAGEQAAARDIWKLQQVRRGFQPFFRKAAGGAGRMLTGLGPRKAFDPPRLDPELLTGRPVVLGADVFVQESSELALELAWADLRGDLAALELTTDVSRERAPTRIDLAPRTHGRRLGNLQFSLGRLPPGATRVEVTLVDASGRTSSPYSLMLPF